MTGLKLGRSAHTEGRTQAEGVRERVLREIFGAVRVEVTGDWRRLHSEELRGLCCSPDVIRVRE